MAQNSVGSTETLPLGTANVVSYTVTIPYTGNYDKIRCIYGIDENHGYEGTISNNACTFTGNAANQKLYYKLMASDITSGNSAKIYENGGTVTTSNFERISISELALGDYIYLKPTKTSYSITSDMTGCVSGIYSHYCNGINGEPQTINPSELTVWRVIRKISNGTVDVVSDGVSSTKVYFYGTVGYQKVIQTLNMIASQYTNSDYVQSTRHMGYDGTATEYITNTSKLEQISPSPWAKATSESTTPSDESLGAGDLGYQTDLDLARAINGAIIASTDNPLAYFLASRQYSISDSYG